LQHALGDLSEEQRTTLRLHFFEGFTINEISEKLGQSRVNVRNYYYRGLERLRSVMEPKEATRPQ
jgi:RNA polymerase sigma-70 factor (ECF subfamily)